MASKKRTAKKILKKAKQAARKLVQTAEEQYGAQQKIITHQDSEFKSLMVSFLFFRAMLEQSPVTEAVDWAQLAETCNLEDENEAKEIYEELMELGKGQLFSDGEEDGDEGHQGDDNIEGDEEPEDGESGDGGEAKKAVEVDSNK